MMLELKFKQDEFSNWIEEFLPDFSRDIRKVEVPTGFSDVKSIITLGESPLGVRVFIIETLKDPSGRKVGLAKDSFSLLKNYGTPNALIAYYSENSDNWRFSLLTSTPVWNDGKIITKLSNPKRHSYVLGPNAKVNTPNKFLIKKGKALDFIDLKSRFSLEVVNKEFYKEISESFTKLVGGIKGEGKNKKTYESLLKLPSANDHSQISIEFAVRLIGRIIFCWFLREKISKTGSSLMPKELLSLQALSMNSDYYHKILEPIFFEILNKNVKSRKPTYDDGYFSKIPYLNGGLFSPHDDDYFSYNEGKQAQNHNTVIVPDAWFNELFQILETYNFTIDENTSIDEELSIDPEMLGRIFENLLAEINPETGESARKSTGSYYTPRAIVDYMVDESLLLYLKQTTSINEDKLRAIISYDLSDDALYPLNETEKKSVVDAIEKVKILDPACGSGAFPIGALQKIVFILQQIDPEGKLWFARQIEGAIPELKRLMEKEFKNKNFDYLRKMGIIRKNIFGVDIQPIATEISRLRCFLTLVVDEMIEEDEENRGIEPLPNLDFKFVTANSLISLPRVNGENVQKELFDDQENISKLKEVRDDYFNSNGVEREGLKHAFGNIQRDMLKRMIDIGQSPELTRKLSDWEPFSHKASAWFDPEWMFGVKNGFDIVIANPPYGESIKKNKEYFKTKYLTTEGKYEIFKFFIEKGLRLMKERGSLCFITPDTWLRLGYFKKLRTLILQDYALTRITETIYNIFENATVDNVVFWVINQKPSENASFTVLDSNFEYLNEIKISRIDNHVINLKDKPETIKKIEFNKLQLRDYCEVWQGLIAYSKKDQPRIYTSTNKETDLHRKLLFGKDIGQYYINWSGQYLKYGKWLHRPRPSYIFDHEKILVQRIRNPKLKRRLICAYDSKGYINGTGLSNVLLKKNKNPQHLKYLVGLLNSQLINYWFSYYYVDVNIKPDQLRVIPIVREKNALQEQIIELVDKILYITKSTDFLQNLIKQASVKEYETQIDLLVYELYDLTLEEIKIVEAST